MAKKGNFNLKSSSLATDIIQFFVFCGRCTFCGFGRLNKIPVSYLSRNKYTSEYLKKLNIKNKPSKVHEKCFAQYNTKCLKLKKTLKWRELFVTNRIII